MSDLNLVQMCNGQEPWEYKLKQTKSWIIVTDSSSPIFKLKISMRMWETVFVGQNSENETIVPARYNCITPRPSWRRSRVEPNWAELCQIELSRPQQFKMSKGFKKNWSKPDSDFLIFFAHFARFCFKDWLKPMLWIVINFWMRYALMAHLPIYSKLN